MSERGLGDMTTVFTVEVALRDGVFDDASSIGSGGGDGGTQELLDSGAARYRTEQGSLHGGPTHPERREPYETHTSSIGPECSTKTPRNRDTPLDDLNRSLEQLLHQLLVVDSSTQTQSASRGFVSSPDGDAADQDWNHRHSTADPHLDDVPLYVWTTTETDRRTTAASLGPDFSPQAPKNENDLNAHDPPCPTSSVLPQPRQSFGGRLPTPAVFPPSMPTYEASHGDGPHLPPQLQRLSYHASTSAASGAAPTLLPRPAYVAGWNPLCVYQDPSVPPLVPVLPFPPPPPMPPIPMPAGIVPTGTTDSYLGHLHRMIEWKGAMIREKDRECDELRRALRAVTDEIRSLRVGNARLRSRIDHQGDQMRHELAAIRREMGPAAAAAAAAAASQTNRPGEGPAGRSSTPRRRRRQRRRRRRQQQPNLHHLQQPELGDDICFDAIAAATESKPPSTSTSPLRASSRGVPTDAAAAAAAGWPSPFGHVDGTAAASHLYNKPSSTTTATTAPTSEPSSTSLSTPPPPVPVPLSSWFPFPSADGFDRGGTPPSSSVVKDDSKEAALLGAGVAPVPALSPRQLFAVLTRGVATAAPPIA